MINHKYLKRKLKIVLKTEYDYLIVIVGRLLTKDFLIKLRQKNPNAKFILYLWDDVKRVENFQEVRDMYDCIYSFDPVDCEYYHLRHLPLFFTEVSSGYNKNKEFDIYSAMSAHSDRIQVASAILDQINDNGLKGHIEICLGRFKYLQYMIEKTIKNKKLRQGMLYIRKPSKEDVNYKNINKSKAVLDIQYTSQIGLTMRTIECLGLNAKIITTNKSIQQYDFYCKDNIYIIDRAEPIIDFSFLDNSYREIDPDIKKKYALDHWIDVVINGGMGGDYFSKK